MNSPKLKALETQYFGNVPDRFTGKAIVSEKTYYVIEGEFIDEIEFSCDDEEFLNHIEFLGLSLYPW